VDATSDYVPPKDINPATGKTKTAEQSEQPTGESDKESKNFLFGYLPNFINAEELDAWIKSGGVEEAYSKLSAEDKEKFKASVDKQYQLIAKYNKPLSDEEFAAAKEKNRAQKKQM
jgi:hypothetical protein